MNESSFSTQRFKILFYRSARKCFLNLSWGDSPLLDLLHELAASRRFLLENRTLSTDLTKLRN